MLLMKSIARKSPPAHPRQQHLPGRRTPINMPALGVRRRHTQSYSVDPLQADRRGRGHRPAGGLAGLGRSRPTSISTACSVRACGSRASRSARKRSSSRSFSRRTAARSRRLAQQRSLVPARRDHRERHGPRVRAAARARRRARVERAADVARLEQGRGRHPRVLLPRPGRPPPRGPALSAGQGRRDAGRPRTACFSASTTRRSSSQTPTPACVLPRRARMRVAAAARTTARSRSG